MLIFCWISLLSQDVIKFGPLAKTLGLVMLNKPQIIPSIFKQVINESETSVLRLSLLGYHLAQIAQDDDDLFSLWFVCRCLHVNLKT